MSAVRKLSIIQVIVILIICAWLFSYKTGFALVYEKMVKRYKLYFRASIVQKQEINDRELSSVELYTFIKDYLSSIKVRNGK